MKKFLKKTTVLLGFALFVAAPIMSVATPVTSSVVAACGDEGIMGIPAWYRGLTDANNDCAIKSPDGSADELSKFVWKIVLNIINMALVVVAYIAVFFIIYGGFLYMTGGSQPGQLEKAKKSIMNAVIGLVIAMASVAILNLIFGIIK